MILVTYMYHSPLSLLDTSMSDTPSGIELTKELLGTAIKPEDTGEELAKKQQRFNLILDGIVSMSAGLTLGAVTGTISTFRMLTDKKNGRLPKTLQDFPTALLVQRIYRGHFIRGIVAAVGAACAYGAVTQTEELSKFQMPAVVRGFIPGAVGGALMGNLKGTP